MEQTANEQVGIPQLERGKDPMRDHWAESPFQTPDCHPVYTVALIHSRVGETENATLSALSLSCKHLCLCHCRSNDVLISVFRVFWILLYAIRIRRILIYTFESQYCTIGWGTARASYRVSYCSSRSKSNNVIVIYCVATDFRLSVHLANLHRAPTSNCFVHV